MAVYIYFINDTISFQFSLSNSFIGLTLDFCPKNQIINNFYFLKNFLRYLDFNEYSPQKKYQRLTKKKNYKDRREASENSST